jgi:quinone-modifying oxidoreductase subunit QmoA
VKSKTILVVGGGISGISTAIEASEAGYEVVLVEKNAYLGGRVIQSYQYFPKLCPPICGMEINIRRLKSSGRVHHLTLAEVEKITGEPGNYRATIKQQPRFVNEKCTACKDCVEACPLDRPNMFNWNMDQTKAVYLPHEAAYPLRYVIDPDVCEGASCSKCVEVCKYNAIDLNEQPCSEEIEVGAVVFATGWEPYDAAKVENLGFGKYENIITNVMMERLSAVNGPTGGQIKRPSDGKEINSIAFVQCAGSRDENHLKHCSGVCCLASLKQATYVRSQYPDAQVYIFYIDVRAPGKLEDFYVAQQADEKISLIKGKVAKIEEDPQSKSLTVTAEDVLGGGRVHQAVDMVVLATGMVPSKLNIDVPNGLIIDEQGFLVAEQNQPGILAAGCSKRPVDVAVCVRDATGTALKAIQNCV